MIKLIRTFILLLLLLLAMPAIAAMRSVEYQIYTAAKDPPPPGTNPNEDLRESPFFQTTVGTGPSIVLIAGRLYNDQYWSKFVDKYKDKYTFHIFLFRGMNFVNRSIFHHSRDSYEYVGEILKYKKVENAILIGQEFGGNTAVQLANSKKIKFDKVVLIDTFLDYQVLGLKNTDDEYLVKHPLNFDYNAHLLDKNDKSRYMKESKKELHVSTVTHSICETKLSKDGSCNGRYFYCCMTDGSVNFIIRNYFYNINQIESYKNIKIEKYAFFNTGWLAENEKLDTHKMIGSQFDENTKLIFINNNSIHLKPEQLSDIFEIITSQ